MLILLIFVVVVAYISQHTICIFYSHFILKNFPILLYFFLPICSLSKKLFIYFSKIKSWRNRQHFSQVVSNWKVYNFFALHKELIPKLIHKVWNVSTWYEFAQMYYVFYIIFYSNCWHTHPLCRYGDWKLTFEISRNHFSVTSLTELFS